MRAYFRLRQLPEPQGVSDEDIRLMKRRGLLNSLYIGRALMVVLLFLPNAITTQMSFTQRRHFWPTPLLVGLCLSVVVFLVFNHRELVNFREKLRRYLESKDYERSPREP